MNYTVTPKMVSIDGDKLALIKKDLGKYPSESAFLKERADKLLDVENFSVTKKELIPASGDPHDYMTMGTYWWPDPDKADGLPYIRRDGVHNPKAKDRNTYQAMSESAFTLAYAAYLFDRRDYAEKSLELLSAWHLDKETYMAPHAEYSQAIPGICEGRGIGLIDFRMSHNVFDACEILYALGVMSNETYLAMKEWYVKFINWMITSEKGIFIDNYFNNHGTYYDLQLMNAAVFTSRPELFKRVAVSSYGKRIKTQIKADGAQPHELERTNAMSYSVMNLLGLAKISALASRFGYKEYASADRDTESFLIGRAAEFLAPYIKDQSAFPYQQISPSDQSGSMIKVFLLLYSITNEKRYLDMAEAIDEPKHMSHIMPF